ncbi:hypothetical protein I312_106021 [Cryptococcus bacillisporus CA1280]|uniref:uncharacterized protein n=1 Tax=Cryptococcus bacillisporus CA1280 TaxID=1296109 RepID=UPI0033673309
MSSNIISFLEFRAARRPPGIAVVVPRSISEQQADQERCEDCAGNWLQMTSTDLPTYRVFALYVPFLLAAVTERAKMGSIIYIFGEPYHLSSLHGLLRTSTTISSPFFDFNLETLNNPN